MTNTAIEPTKDEMYEVHCLGGNLGEYGRARRAGATHAECVEILNLGVGLGAWDGSQCKWISWYRDARVAGIPHVEIVAAVTTRGYPCVWADGRVRLVGGMSFVRRVPVQGVPAVVEVQVGQGLPGFTIVGLSDAACRSTHDRVRAAVLNSGLKWPHHRITVNLAPSRGWTLASHDLAIAVGVLASDGQITADMSGMAFIGELGLDGSVRPVSGVLPMVASLALGGVRREVVVPAANTAEVRSLGRHVVRPVVRPVESLGEVVRCLRGEPWGRSAQVVAP